jgi:hypothetical protein
LPRAVQRRAAALRRPRRMGARDAQHGEDAVSPTPPIPNGLASATGAAAANIALGAVTASGRRRLLDASVPVTVSGSGASTAAASSLVAALTNLPASVARAVGASGVAASTPSVTAQVTVTTSASSAASAVNIASTLGNPTAVQSGLASNGVAVSVAVTKQPAIVASSPSPPPPPPPAVKSGSMPRSRAQLSSILVISASLFL